MTREEREDAINFLKGYLDEEVYTEKCRNAHKMAIKALEQEPCIQEKQANADKIDAVYIDGFKAGYSQARFDLEQETCEDCVSRKDAIIQLSHNKTGDDDCDVIVQSDIETIKALPPVKPKQKIGRWINGNSICPCCGEDKFKDLDADIYADWRPKYCPNCGTKMESEE